MKRRRVSVFILCCSVAATGLCEAARAQVLHNYGANINAVSGTYVYVEGSFLNSSYSGTAGTTENQGTVIVTGNWTNNTSDSVYTLHDGTGMTEMKGSAVQTIGGTGPTWFEELKINNSTSGTAVSLGLNAYVTDSLALVDGVVVTGANVLVIENTGENKVGAFSGASFVYGYLRRSFAVNTDVYEFPVGHGTAPVNYNRADITNGSLNLSGSPDFITVSADTNEEQNNNIDINLGTSQDGTPIIDVVGDPSAKAVEWSISPSNAAVSSGDYGVRLYVANTGLSASDDNAFCPVKRPDGSTNYVDWDTEDGTTAIPSADSPGRIYDSGNGYAERTGYTAFSLHAIGKGSGSLPIELLSFSAQWDEQIEKTVRLQWVTASETNNDYFTVERSPDGLHFEPVVTLPGSGTSQAVLQYRAYDETPIAHAVSYYRLQQVDHDGAFSYSSPVVLRPNPGTGSTFKLVSVDRSGLLQYRLSADRSRTGWIHIAGMEGSRLLSVGYEAAEGISSGSIDVRFLAAGVYFIFFTSKDGSLIAGRKFLIV